MRLSLFVFATLILFMPSQIVAAQDWALVDNFERADSYYHGHGWETLTPGYWKVENNALRRRMSNVGDGNPITSFPMHWMRRGQVVGPRRGNRTPSLPMGMIWRRDWALEGNYSVRADFTIHNQSPEGRGENEGFLGLCWGGGSLYESRNFGRAQEGDSSWMAIWKKSGRFQIVDHSSQNQSVNDSESVNGLALEDGDQLQIEVIVSGPVDGPATVTAILRHEGEESTIVTEGVDRQLYTEGFFGLACYGSLDFDVNQVEINRGANAPNPLVINDLHVCYPLGDTLKQVEGNWVCKFIAMLRSDGEEVVIRVADSPEPAGGWEQVPVAGSAKIVNNDWRRNTAVVHVTLPVNPGEATQYYTVWKDGVNVTPDPRPAEEYEGYLGPKRYVGRLPQLAAPYRICTLGGHAIHGNSTTLPESRTFQRNWIHGQPTEGAYQHFEDFNFQVVNWDDDVWYLELLFPPPSTDDAYKIITLTIANPTTRWQMMRHWNIINPGDHDYGMDDVKGPEQIVVRQRDDLGQDAEYMRRNFNINHHLVEGLEEPVGDTNPKDWRLWKMPNGDFSIMVLESRNWRSPTDTDMWINGGWSHATGLYHRGDPTRSLLGEEQFGWFAETLRTDTSPLILITGVNCMHPVFNRVGGAFGFDKSSMDYAAWTTAGIDRMLDVMGERPGLLSVYGDIHLASVVENVEQRILESSCGPIGRGGSRRLKDDFAPLMQDYDGRNVQVHALYHERFDSPDLNPRTDTPMHWNFLEKEFDPREADPTISLKIRNIIDSPEDEPRGGGVIDRTASSTGRVPSCGLPPLTTLPSADVYFRSLNGRPLRGIRSMPDGTVPLSGLVDVEPGTSLLMVATDGEAADSQIIITTEPASE